MGEPLLPARHASSVLFSRGPRLWNRASPRFLVASLFQVRFTVLWLAPVRLRVRPPRSRSRTRSASPAVTSPKPPAPPPLHSYLLTLACDRVRLVCPFCLSPPTALASCLHPTLYIPPASLSPPWPLRPAHTHISTTTTTHINTSPHTNTNHAHASQTCHFRHELASAPFNAAPRCRASSLPAFSF